jgi:hypothetical protein
MLCSLLATYQRDLVYAFLGLLLDDTQGTGALLPNYSLSTRRAISESGCKLSTALAKPVNYQWPLPTLEKVSYADVYLAAQHLF